MNTFKNNIIELAHSLEKERDRAFDLWTWLPSHQEAVKHHGDYYCEQTPSTHDILIEAAIYIGHLKALLNNNIVLTEEQIKDASEFYECPCGEHKR